MIWGESKMNLFFPLECLLKIIPGGRPSEIDFFLEKAHRNVFLDFRPHFQIINRRPLSFLLIFPKLLIVLSYNLRGMLREHSRCNTNKTEEPKYNFFIESVPMINIRP